MSPRVVALAAGLVAMLATIASADSVVSRKAPERQRAAWVARQPDAERAESYADDALAFRRAQLEDEHGKVPPNAFVDAAEAADGLRTTTARRSSSKSVAGIARGA